MSVETVNQFLQKVSEDTPLQEELTKVLESAENDREAATELGAKHGYQFTSEELWQGIQNRQSEFQVSQNQEELSDEELEAVAGGCMRPPLTTVITKPGRPPW
jgi:predicted ribosomally synthesized peptide with nif11-like leader